MPKLVSKTGEPVIGPCLWVISKNNLKYEELLEKYAPEIHAGVPISDPAYMAMFEEFLKDTNQEVTND